MVTSANTVAKANAIESKPVCRPQDVASAVAPAAWLEGIPPGPINHLKLNLFFLITPKSTLIPWVKIHTVIVINNILLSNGDFKRVCLYKKFGSLTILRA